MLRNPECTTSLAELCETAVPETIETLLAQEPKITDPELVRAVGGAAAGAASMRRSWGARTLPPTHAHTHTQPHTHVRAQLDDLTFTRECLRSNRRKLTSVERYEKELRAKKFEWTALHSPDFWKEYATHFEADGFKLVGEIRNLLRDPEVSNETLAVAVADLGEFAVAHPQGRTVLQALDVRPAVMALLKHDNEEVRQQALLACSKLLVARWQFVSGTTPAAAAGGGGGGAAAGAAAVAAKA